MGKGDRRKSKKKQPLPNLVVAAPKPDMRRTKDRIRAAMDEDPKRAALEARCRMMGWSATRESLQDVSAPHFGAQIGFVMEGEGLHRNEINRLWHTFKAWAQAEDSYHKHYLGRAKYPKAAAITMVSERIELDESQNVDIRDPEERARDAVAQFIRWQAYLHKLTAREFTGCHDALTERVDLWHNGAATRSGINALDGLRALHRVVENGS